MGLLGMDSNPRFNVKKQWPRCMYVFMSMCMESNLAEARALPTYVFVFIFVFIYIYIYMFCVNSAK